MNYKERYEKALEKAREYNNVYKDHTMMSYAKGALEEIFPELKESEDEKIRNGLVRLLKELLELGGVAEDEWDRKECEKYIAWLEKQPEQNQTDKIEPMFKIGNWIIFNENHNSIYQIEKIDNYRYYLRHYLGGTLSVHFDNELIRLWNIDDAKDGDVLAFKNDIDGIIICKSPTNYDTESYCRLVNDNFINEEEIGWDSTLLVPATKEQRDLLFQKMEEAGYEWDAEKKELKKISKQHLISNYFNAEYERGKADALKSVAWSEEDEKMFRNLNSLIYVVRDSDCDSKEKLKLSNWFKSIKGRVGCEANCITTKEWSEEDEAIAVAIKCFIQNSKEDFACNAIHKNDALKWFKSIKYRVQPK